MKNTFFSSLFKHNKVIKKEESKVLQTLKTLQNNSNLTIFFDVTIYHHKQSYNIPLIIYDEYRGLYLFEIKDWSYQDLKDARITKAKQQKSAQNTLAFDNMQTFIRRKFNEIIHTDGVQIFNYLLMDNLSSHEYQNLDDTLKATLVTEKIIFANETKKDIIHKLQLQEAQLSSLGSEDTILGTLFTQYSILDKQNELHLLNPEQKAFIDLELSDLTYLQGVSKSGKSSLLLLKSLVEILKNPFQTIVILKATNLARDILHKQLIDTIEHAIIELDMLSIQIMTPQELLQSSHHKNLTILCDDAHLLEKKAFATLLNNYTNAKKVFVNAVDKNPDFILIQDYQNKHKSVIFQQTHPYAKALNILQSLLKKSNANDIIIVSDKETALKLEEDLKSFVREKFFVIDSSEKLIKQNLNGVLLTGYDDLNELTCEHIILLNSDSVDTEKLSYAIQLANSSANILYEEESPKIQELREEYENN